MKNFLAILIMIGFVNCALAQDTASIDIFANGVTIDSVIRHFKSFVTTADTGEGSYAARLAEFEMFWRDRAVANDGNGNMFLFCASL
jgi:hypothetical protein